MWFKKIIFRFDIYLIRFNYFINSPYSILIAINHWNHQFPSPTLLKQWNHNWKLLYLQLP